MTKMITANTHQIKSLLTLLKLANILSCTRKNSFGSIKTCKNKLILEKNVPTIIPTSSKKYIERSPVLNNKRYRMNANSTIDRTDKTKFICWLTTVICVEPKKKINNVCKSK